MTRRVIASALAAALCAASVSGCGGGGGGPQVGAIVANPPPVLPPPPPPPPPTPGPPSSAVAFECWDMCGVGTGALNTVILTGVGKSTSQVTTVPFTSLTWGAIGAAPQTLTLRVNSVLSPTGVWLVDTAPRVTFQEGTDAFTTRTIPMPSGAFTYTVAGWSGNPAADDPTSLLVYNSPGMLRFTTFGWWFAPEIAGQTLRYGSFAVGNQTVGTAIPTIGSATFDGRLFATYFPGAPTTEVWVAAPMSLSVNFGARSANFTSSNWSDATQTYSGTALSGLLTYGAGQNALSGILTTSNGAFSGSVDARFFGGVAQEVGGSFILTPTAPTGAGQVIGAFGATRF